MRQDQHRRGAELHLVDIRASDDCMDPAALGVTQGARLPGIVALDVALA